MGPATSCVPARIAARMNVLEIGSAQGLSSLGKSLKRKGNAVAQPEVVIYTKFGCGYCFRAKRLLDSKGVTYTEHDVTMGGAMRDEMLARAPMARTVPQIFIGQTHVGGSDELHALDTSGRLDTLLGTA